MRRGGFAVSGQQLPGVPVQHGSGLRHRAAGAEHPDRLQRPDFSRARRVLCHRRLCGRDPDGACRLAILGDFAGGGNRLFYFWIPVRSAGVAAARPLSGAGDLRACGGDAAASQVQTHRALDRRRARHRHHQTRSAVRAETHPGPVALSVHAGDRGRHVRHRLESVTRACGACAGGDT